MHLTNGARTSRKMFAEQSWIESLQSWWETVPWVTYLRVQCARRPLMWFHSCRHGVTIRPKPPSNGNWDASDLLMFSTHHINGWHSKTGCWLGSTCVHVTVWLRSHPRGMQGAICRCDEFAVMGEGRGESNQSSSSPAATWMYNSLFFCVWGQKHTD